MTDFWPFVARSSGIRPEKHIRSILSKRCFSVVVAVVVVVFVAAQKSSKAKMLKCASAGVQLCSLKSESLLLLLFLFLLQ